MRGGHLYVALTAAVFTLVPPSCCRNASSDETRTKLSGSTVDFDSFREQFRRMYVVNSEELKRRQRYFRNATKRHAYLNSFSAAPQSAKYGINQFSDVSQKEFRDLYLRGSADRAPLFSGLKSEGLPAKFDWRDKAVVAPVQNQQECGSCWAFSVVGAMQSVHAIGGSQLEQLSVQQVLDCSVLNQGCNGGSPFQALNWLKQTRVKLVPQSEYPYKAKTGICHFFSQSRGSVAVKNFTAHDFRPRHHGPYVMSLAEEGITAIPSGDHLVEGQDEVAVGYLDVCNERMKEERGESGQEDAMMGQLVERGPLAAIVDAVSWQDYLGGIIQHHCSSQWSNHAVLVVGYNTIGDIPYWIVQNSWGTTWGNEGYVYIKIGGNICGIADSVAAVVL